MDSFLTDFSKAHAAAGAFIVAAAAVLYWYLFIRKTRVQKLVEAIPCVEEGVWQVAKTFFSREAPNYLLNKSRSSAINSKVFRLPIPTPGSPAFVIVCDYKIARKVLEDTKSLKNRHAYRMFDDVAGGVNFFTAEGLRWRHVRKSLAPVFASERSFYPALLDCIHQWMDASLAPLIQAGKPVDISEEMLKITIDVIGRVGFDYEWNSNNNNNGDDDEAKIVLEGLQIAYLDYFREAVPTNTFRYLAGSLHPARRKARRAVNAMKDVCRNILRSHRERKAASLPYDPKSIICALDENTNYESDEERICDMVLICAGGFDTSAFSLTWILFELARHPEEQSRLRAELQRCSSDEEAWNCPALKRVVRESMRLNSTAALGSLRQIAKEIVVPATKTMPSLVLPEGSVCATPFYCIHRDADVFHEKPDEFIPSRWENNAANGGDNADMMAAFLPFSIGRRNCVGQALANAELHVTIAELIRRYEFTVQDPGFTDYYITLKQVNCMLWVKPI